MRPTVPNGAPRFVEESHGQGGRLARPAFNPMTIDDDPSRPTTASASSISRSRTTCAADGSLDPSCSRQVEDQARPSSAAARSQAMDAHYRAGLHAAHRPAALEAFDLDARGSANATASNPHGQSVLQARRLVEAGVPLVTVFWPNDGITNVSVYWDTHNRNFIDLKTRLMPAADQAFSALLDDLTCAGLLDETLVVWTGEFGRTPRVGPERSSAARGRAATAATTGRTASPACWPAAGSAAASSTARPTARPPTRPATRSRRRRRRHGLPSPRR